MKTILFNIFFCCALFGQQWQWQHPKPQGNDLNKIYFVDQNYGYIAGAGVILKTTDAGSSWNKLNSNTRFNIYGIFFNTRDSGWLCGYKSGVGGIIERTVNGGLNWETVYIDSGFNDLRSIKFVCLSPLLMLNKK